MARPKKAPEQLQNVPIKVMVTALQKERIADAANAAQAEDVSTWLRGVIFEAAEHAIAAAKGRRRRKRA